MSLGRPMNEYEAALSSAVETLIGTAIELGIDRHALAARFREIAGAQKNHGLERAASVSEMYAYFAESVSRSAPGAHGR